MPSDDQIRQILSDWHYPHMLGGTTSVNASAAPAMGLSQVARGKLAGQAKVVFPHGPIPACAGETKKHRLMPVPSGAYPRVRGGNVGGGACQNQGRGLSPRARGKQMLCKFTGLVLGPIPACAGETADRAVTPESMRAYPRVRGGNSASPVNTSAGPGLSPRARGKRKRGDARAEHPGPIPACAGETFGSSSPSL